MPFKDIADLVVAISRLLAATVGNDQPFCSEASAVCCKGNK